MERFTGCRVRVEFDDGSPPFEDDDAELALDSERLLLHYWDDQGVVVLVGERAADGSFAWMARSRPRSGTLRSDGARGFEGCWAEGSRGGGLLVKLPGDESGS